MPQSSASIRIALCQVNTVVGDIAGNVEMVLEGMQRAEAAGANIVVFPELTLTGYPPEDLLLKPGFIADNLDALNRVAAASGDCTAIVGYVDRTTDLFNAAAICRNGEVIGRYYKQVLPNYGPFDEQRYFGSAESTNTVYEIAGVKVGVTICEDAWFKNGPISRAVISGAELVVNINASPFFAGRLRDREAMLRERIDETHVPIVYLNQIGGQDELVFDGGSVVMNEHGEVVASAVQFAEETLIVDLDVPVHSGLLSKKGPIITDSAQKSEISGLKAVPMTATEEIYSALVLGTRDYVQKNGFTEVVIALSGGVDSSLVAAIAVDAIGSANVHGVLMPSRYSSDHSITDALALAENLGIETQTIPIEPAHAALQQMVKESIGGDLVGLTDENLQSRIRGVTVMALSNQFNWLVLTTGNKSESAVGYSTLYGDTAGGFAVIKDVAKTQVYELCHWRNAQSRLDSDTGGEFIPVSILTKPPSAELRPNQKDEDSLPPYDVLDPILEAYVEHDQTAQEIEAKGFDPVLVRRIIRLVDLAEYKRRQSPLGVRVTRKAFGKDRRVPITNRYPG